MVLYFYVRCLRGGVARLKSHQYTAATVAAREGSSIYVEEKVCQSDIYVMKAHLPSKFHPLSFRAYLEYTFDSFSYLP